MKRHSARGIQLASRLLIDDRQGSLDTPGRSIWTGGHQRIEHVCDRDDPGAKRDLVPLETVGITTAINSLVMMPDSGHLTLTYDYRDT